MKKTTDGKRAHELELIEVEERGKENGYSNSKLYVLDGEAGFYRKVTRQRASEGNGAITAVFMGSLIDLVPAPGIAAELAEANYGFIPGHAWKSDISNQLETLTKSIVGTAAEPGKVEEPKVIPKEPETIPVTPTATERVETEIPEEVPANEIEGMYITEDGEIIHEEIPATIPPSDPAAKV